MTGRAWGESAMGAESVIMEAKAVELYAPIPVAVHMWFADGAGWAYHPDIGNDVLEEIIRTVTPVLYSSESESKAIRKCPAGLLVIEKLPQEKCDDASAIARSPHALRVAVVSHSVLGTCFPAEQADTDRFGEQMFRELGRLAYPTKRGRCESLVVWAKAAPPVLPTPDVGGEPAPTPEHVQTDELAKENGSLKQELADLRRENEYLRKTIPTRGQRLFNTMAIVLLTALLTAAAIYVVVVNSGLP